VYIAHRKLTLEAVAKPQLHQTHRVISGWSFVVALDGVARSAEMDAGVTAPNFLGHLGYRSGRKDGTASGSGTHYGSAPHLYVVRVAAVRDGISRLLLGIRRQRCGSLSTYLLKKEVLGFFSR
jgi:hypothetical protein